MFIRSHLNPFQRIEVHLSREFVENININELLHSSVNSHNEKLSPEYKIQIAARLKCLYCKNIQLDILSPLLS